MSGLVGGNGVVKRWLCARLPYGSSYPWLFSTAAFAAKLLTPDMEMRALRPVLCKFGMIAHQCHRIGQDYC